ncbi:MAG TPA: hypothetical protein PKE30_12010, partial [Niabella sp.]|nr:hypothetical protein [Niabella sp.]
TYSYSYSDNNFLTSDFWLRSTDFFRLKNIEVAYTFAKGAWMQRLRLNALRIFATGNNIYTFKNDLTDIGIDPEAPDGRNKYIFPLLKTYNFGLNVQF